MSVQSTIKRKDRAGYTRPQERRADRDADLNHAIPPMVDRLLRRLLVGDSRGNVMHGFETTGRDAWKMIPAGNCRHARLAACAVV